MNLHLTEFNIPKEILKWGDSQPAYQRQHIGTHIDCYNLLNIVLLNELKGLRVYRLRKYLMKGSNHYE